MKVTFAWALMLFIAGAMAGAWAYSKVDYRERYLETMERQATALETLADCYEH